MRGRKNWHELKKPTLAFLDSAEWIKRQKANKHNFVMCSKMCNTIVANFYVHYHKHIVNGEVEQTSEPQIVVWHSLKLDRKKRGPLTSSQQRMLRRKS